MQVTGFGADGTITVFNFDFTGNIDFELNSTTMTTSLMNHFSYRLAKVRPDKTIHNSDISLNQSHHLPCRRKNHLQAYHYGANLI
jgi:hypothetical protein